MISNSTIQYSGFSVLNAIVYVYLCYCRMTDLRQQKSKLSRQIRDKEEELDDTRQQLESLKLDIRKGEKSKRDVSHM